MRRRTRRIGIGAFALCNAALIVPAARAAAVYWDRNGVTEGAANTGTSANGNWDAATANWTTAAAGDGATGTYAAISGGASTADVIFSAGTVGGSNLATGLSLITVSAATSANSITIKNGAVSITGSSVTVGSGGINLTSSAIGNSSIAAAPISTSQAWTNNSYYSLNTTSATGVSSPSTASTLTLTGSGLGGFNFAGMTNGAGGLNLEVALTGAGRAVIGGSNTGFTGNIILTSGILTNNNSNAFNTVSAGTLTFNGGTLQYGAGAGADYSAKFTTVAGQQFKIDTNFVGVTYASPIAAANSSLTKLGYGTLGLGGANSFTNGVSINGGVLSLTNALALGSSGVISFANGGVLRHSSTNTVDYSSRFSNAAGQVITLDPNAQTIALATDLTGGSLVITSNTNAGVVNLSGNLTSGFGKLTMATVGARASNGTDNTLNVTGTNNQYAGGTAVTGGILSVGAASTLGANTAGNTINVSGSGILQLNAATNVGSNQTIVLGDALAPFANPNSSGVTINLTNGAVAILDLRYNPVSGLPAHTSSANSPVVIAVSNVVTGFTNAITLANQEFFGARLSTTYAATSINLDASANDTYRLGGGGWAGISVPTLTLTGPNVLADALDATPRNLIVGVTPLADRLGVPNGTGIVSLQSANNYSGSTLVNVNSTLDLATNSTTTATIFNSSSLNVKGTLSITNTNSVTGNVNRIGDSSAVTLDGGVLTMNVGSATTSTEDVGPLVLAARQNNITLTTAANKALVLQADSITRNNRAAMLLRGSTTLGASGTLNTARLTLDSTSGLTLAGNSDAAGIGTLKDLKIVPWIVASNTSTAATETFATYDTTTASLRPLSIGNETVALASGAGLNVYEDFGVTTTTTVNGLTANSIVIANSASATALTITGTGTFASSSGALAYTGSKTVTVGALTGSYDAIALGSAGTPEAVVYVESGGILNLNSPVNTSTAYGLTKFGSGTLNLGAANTFTGPIVQNGGTLSLNNANSASSMTVNGGTLVANAVGALGSGTVTVNGGANLQIGRGTSGTVTLGSGSINLSDGATLTNDQNNSGTYEIGTVNVLGNARFIVTGGGTGSRTYTVPTFVMGTDKSLGVNFTQGSGITQNITTLTLNGTNTLRLTPTNSQTLRINNIGEGTSGSDLVLYNVFPANTYLAALEINGASSYTGDTQIKTGIVRVISTGRLGSGDVSVSATGVLQLDNNTVINDLSTLTVDSGAVVNLNFFGNEIVGTLVLNGTTYTSGLFNAGTNPDYFTGSGSIAVPEPGSLSVLGLAGAMLLRRRKR